MAKRRRTEIAKITHPAARLVTFSKRRRGLFKKASDLCCLCGARAAIVVFSPAGKPYSIGDDVIADYLRGGDSDVMLPMDLTERIEADWDACETEEDLESFISRYEAVRDCARQKLKALEDASQVKVGGGDSHILSEDEVDLLYNSFGGGPALMDLLTDGDGDGDAFWTSPENLAAGGGSSAVESIPAAVRDCVSEKLKASEDESQVKVVAGDSHILNEEEMDSLFESLGRCPALSDLLNDGNGVVFWTSPIARPPAGESTLVRSDLQDCGSDAAGGGSSGVACTPVCSDLEGRGFDPDDFLCQLEDCDVDGDGDGLLTWLEDSAVGGGNSGVEAASNGYNPNDFAGLEDLGVL